MEIYDLIKQTINDDNCEILEIFRTGSQIFIDNPNDLDYFAICENYQPQVTRHHIDKLDIIIMDKNAYLARQDFNDYSSSTKRHKLYNYFFNLKDVIYGNFEESYNTLEHATEYKALLKELYWNTIGKAIRKQTIGKSFVHYYIVLKMIENGSTTLTEEMMETIKALYKNENVYEIAPWIEDRLKEVT